MIVVVIINIIAHRICMFFFCLFSVLQDDFLVSKPVRQHLAKYDKQLKKFNVSQALDTALAVRHRKQHYRQQLHMGKTFVFNDVSHYICRQGPGRENQRSQWLSLKSWIEEEL